MEDKEDKSYEELLKSITHEKKRLFLENYPKFRVTAQTCEAVGIAGSTVRSWYKDGVFNSAFGALKKEVSHKLIEEHEKNIDNVAFESTTPAQSRIFGSLVRLRAEAPDKYREKPASGPMIVGNLVVKLDIPAYRDEIKEDKKLLMEGRNGESVTETEDTREGKALQGEA